MRSLAGFRDCRVETNPCHSFHVAASQRLVRPIAIKRSKPYRFRTAPSRFADQHFAGRRLHHHAVAAANWRLRRLHDDGAVAIGRLQRLSGNLQLKRRDARKVWAGRLRSSLAPPDDLRHRNGRRLPPATAPRAAPTARLARDRRPSAVISRPLLMRHVSAPTTVPGNSAKPGRASA